MMIWHGDKILRRIERKPIAGNIAEIIADRAKQNAPVKSGALRQSIHAEGDSVIADAGHASVVELGTATRAAKPYMRPAIEQFDNSDLMKSVR